MLEKVLELIAKAAASCGRDPKDIMLVGISKGQSVEAIQALYGEGLSHFGESRLQEVEKKRPVLSQDISWHLVGTLQTKKVPKAVGTFSLIHSVDSFSLAEKISKVSVMRNLVTDILLQVNASGEQAKHGFSIEACRASFEKMLKFPGIRIKGLMTMAPLTDDEEAVRSCFTKARDLQRELQKQYRLSDFTELSMGMSGDFAIAIECGATIVRIGTKLF